MKILYLDFLSPKGHVLQNTAYISMLSSFSEVYVVCDRALYSFASENIQVMDVDAHIRDGQISTRWDSYRLMLRSLKVAKKIRPDRIFIASYDTLVFAALAKKFYSRYNVFLLQHANIDELSNAIKRKAFDKYSQHVKHVVFVDYIKRYLCDTCNLDEANIFVLPHQLNFYQNHEVTYEYDCVGLSNSNDEQVIQRIIDIEKERGLLKQNGKKVILKSKLSSFDNGFLKVINYFLSKDEFESYLSKTKSVYLPFPMQFKYRMSGTLVDALSNRSIVYGTKIPIIECYQATYPHICKVVESEERLLESIIANKDSSETQECGLEFDRFVELHSNENITEILKGILK